MSVDTFVFRLRVSKWNLSVNGDNILKIFSFICKEPTRVCMISYGCFFTSFFFGLCSTKLHFDGELIISFIVSLYINCFQLLYSYDDISIIGSHSVYRESIPGFNLHPKKLFSSLSVLKSFEYQVKLKKIFALILN